MSKYFDLAVRLARGIQRDGTIYGHETVKDAAIIPEFEAYAGPLDKEGRIPEPIDQFAREAAEDEAMGGFGNNRSQAIMNAVEDIEEDYDE